MKEMGTDIWHSEESLRKSLSFGLPGWKPSDPIIEENPVFGPWTSPKV